MDEIWDLPISIDFQIEKTRSCYSYLVLYLHGTRKKFSLKKQPPWAFGKDQSSLDLGNICRENVSKVHNKTSKQHVLLFKIHNKTTRELSSYFYWYGNFKEVFKDTHKEKAP